MFYTKDGRFLDKLYDQDGNCDTYNYNSTTGYLDSVTDDNTGAQINYTYDENRGQLISVSQTDSYTDITAQNNYTYDESGKLLTKINHSNTDYIIDYDKFYNTTENKVGSQVLTAFDYGTNNNILQKVTYGNGQTVNYNYDKYGNVKELFYNGKLAFSFLSDKTGSVMRHKDFVNNRQYDYDYDTTGRLVRQVKTDISKTDAENKFVSAYEYDYDLNNNITKLASKNGDSSIVHSFTYGKDNLLTEYSSDVSSKVTYTYDGLNRQTKSSVALKTPLDMSYTYYDSNRGENFTTTKIKEETIGKDTYKYEYDTNGNITDIYKKVNNDWQRLYLYEYDEFNQLITFCDYINQKQYRYDYDEAGNILTETVSRIGAHGQLYDSRVNAYGYDDANWGDKLTSYNGETITYDEIGNPLSYRDGMTMTWLNGRKLTTLQSGNDSISYKYDSNGVRTSKTVNGVEYTYEYLNGHLMHETRGEKVFDYCYDANGQLYAVSYKANSSTDAVTYYYAHNWRGDITSIYDGDGNMVAKYEYDVWGNVLTVTDANNKSITDKNHIANLNPFRYRSYYYDSESGFYYLMSRYYDPVVHRFLNADGYFQSGDGILDTNMNAYCRNNPIMYYDPTGEYTLNDLMHIAIDSNNNIKFNINDISMYALMGYSYNEDRFYLSSSGYIYTYDDIIYSIAASTHQSLGLGYGIAYGEKISKFLGFEAFFIMNMVQIDFSAAGDLSFGIGASTGFNISILGWDNSVYNMNGIEYSSDSNTIPDNIIPIRSHKSYALIGFSYDVYYNPDQYISTLNQRISQRRNQYIA